MTVTVRPMRLIFKKVSDHVIHKTIINDAGTIIRSETLNVATIPNLEEYLKDWVKMTKNIPAFNIVAVENDFGFDL